MAPSTIKKSAKKIAQKLTRPICSACRRVRASFEGVGREESYDNEQAKTSSLCTTRAYPMRTLEEAEDTAMYSRVCGHRARPVRRETPTPTSPSTRPVGGRDEAAGNESYLSLAHVMNIHRHDDISDLVPPAGSARSVQQWLSSSSSSSSSMSSSARTISTGQSSRRTTDYQLPQRESRPRIRHVEAASFEDVRLAVSESTLQSRMMLQDERRYLKSCARRRTVGDADQWRTRKNRTTWGQR